MSSLNSVESSVLQMYCSLTRISNHNALALFLVSSASLPSVVFSSTDSPCYVLPTPLDNSQLVSVYPSLKQPAAAVCCAQQHSQAQRKQGGVCSLDMGSAQLIQPCHSQSTWLEWTRFMFTVRRRQPPDECFEVSHSNWFTIHRVEQPSQMPRKMLSWSFTLNLLYTHKSSTL